ncbi:MAG: hypothetical protein K1X53_05115 [Candidatus Sumerlaeaceae bacterium]|nr:hypothetical protein [Candidatus Sumerlaeaceae bacterium]
MKLVKAAALRSVAQSYSSTSAQFQILKSYSEIFYPNSSDEEIIFVSQLDLMDLGKSEAANEIFARLPSE